MRRYLPTLIIAAALGTGLPNAHAGKFRDSFAGRTLNALLNRTPQRTATKGTTPAAKPGLRQRLRQLKAWVASPPKAERPEPTNSVSRPPKSGIRNSGFKAGMQQRWNQFKQTGMGQRVQGWRSGFGSFISKLRSPRQLFRMGRRDTMKTAQTAAQNDPTLWQRARAIVKAKGMSAMAATKKRLQWFGILKRQQAKQDLVALDTAAAQSGF